MCVEADAASKRNDTRKLFNIVKKLNGENTKTSPSAVNKRNGEIASSFSELLDEWAEYFKELLNIDFNIDIDDISAAEVDLNITTTNFTFEEVSVAVERMKTGKSPGKDHNITSEVLRYGGEEIIRNLQTIYNMV